MMPQPLQHAIILYMLSDSVSMHDFCDIYQRGDNYVRQRIFKNISDEYTIDLDVLNWQIIKVCERAMTGSKIIQC